MAAASVATPSSSTAISSSEVSSDSTAAGAINYFSINLILIGSKSPLTVAASPCFFFGT
jgi:hypothetical protein